jgi:hypothetical protein
MVFLRYTGAVIWRLMLLLASVLTGMPAAFGQLPATKSPADAIENTIVTQLLSSREPSQLAWGAHLAANYQQTSAIPAIIPLLRSSDSSVQLTAVDALIRLGGDIPDEDLTAFLSTNRPGPVLVILARDPKKHSDFLMRILDQLNNSDWVAANGILSTAPPPGYAARLLRDWSLHVNVKVWDNSIGFADGGCAWLDFRRVQGDRQGFPPLFLYVIQEGATSGGTVIATGPHPVSYVRQEMPPRGGPCVDRDAHRLDYLKSLAGVSQDSTRARLPDVGQGFRWVDATKYRADADALLTGVRTAVSFICTALLDRGLLTAEEATAWPMLEVVVTDQR